MNSKAKLVFTIKTHKEETNGKPIKLQRQLTPKIIHGFSVDSHRIFKADNSELKFLIKPHPGQFPISLNSSEEPWNHADYLDNMLYFIKHNKELDAETKHFNLNDEVVTQHEVLQTILCTIYKKTDWHILGTKYRDIVYLCLAETDSLNMCPTLQKLRSSDGMERQLKSYLHADSPNENLAISKDNGEFHGVFRCRIAGLSVVYNSVMGAYCEHSWKPRFIECKVIPTNLAVETISDKPEIIYAVMWWAECLLKDVQHIYIARPNEHGNISDLKMSYFDAIVSTKYITNRCTNFLEYTLLHIYNLMTLDNPNAVYQFDYIAEKETLFYSLVPQRNENTFIPDWYRSMLNDET